MTAASARIAAAVAALPLRPGLRVLELGCGPGVALREVARIVGPSGHVLGVDRSAKAIAQARTGCCEGIAAGLIALRHSAAEDLVLLPGEAPYDLAFALRVGAFDGRHPQTGDRALARLRAMLAPGARFFIDTGAPLTELALSPH